jgi:hypothetical protein
MEARMRPQHLPKNGLAVFVKAECETCAMIEPVLAGLAGSETDIVIVTQDDPAFPAGVSVRACGVISSALPV